MAKDLTAVEFITAELRDPLILISILVTLLLGAASWGVLRRLALRPMEQEIARRERAETELRKAHDVLDQRVRERTAELQAANERLHAEIREREQAEAAIKGLSRQNALLLESAGEGIVGLDGECRVTFANPAAARMVGWDASDLGGQHLHVVVHHSKAFGEACPEEFCRLCTTSADSVAQQPLEEVFWRKDGSSFPVECTSTPIIENGRRTGVVVTFSDITERKRAEGALREQEQRYRLLAEHSTDLISRHAPDGVFLYASPASRHRWADEP
jgi:PAS domain S-box-containing protein